MRFAVFTHVEHRYREGKFFAYAPYVREMNHWFGILNSEFEVEVVAPQKEDQNPSGGQVYRKTDISFTRIPSFNLLSLEAVFTAIFKIPLLFYKIIGAMRRADQLHLRCPGNIGLIAAVCQIFFPRKPKTAKYAGNWDPEAKQPWSYKLQRWILSNSFLTRNMTVLVYGEWPGQSKNVKSFFTASFSEKAIFKVQEKEFREPYIFLFVGNLVQGKGIKVALKVIQGLQEKGINCMLEIYGEGPERIPLETFVEEAGIERIEFKGNKSLEELELAYQNAHFVILPSRSEGWPKAVAEGMFFGCISIVTPVSCLPWMIGLERGEQKEERGILLVNRGQRTGEAPKPAEGGIEKDVERILEVLGDRERMRRMSEAAKRWSQGYTVERFEEGIMEVMRG